MLVMHNLVGSDKRCICYFFDLQTTHAEVSSTVIELVGLF